MERTKDKMVDTESEQQIIDALKKENEEFAKIMAKNPHNIRAVKRHYYCMKWEKLRINGLI